MNCNCGGVDGAHSVGDVNCMREKCVKPRKKSCSDRWIIHGENGSITDFTLRQQRGYVQHDCGNWSRPNDCESVNSISA